MTEADIQPDQTLASALDNLSGIERDMAELGKLVRERLFYLIIHDLKDNSDDVLSTGGRLCNAHIQYFLLASNRGKITNTFIQNATDQDFKQYLRFMWNQGLSTKGKGNIRRELSQEKSAVYSAINEAFRSKFVSGTSPLYRLVLLTVCFCLPTNARIVDYLCFFRNALPRI
jgi:hypothetical protein